MPGQHSQQTCSSGRFPYYAWTAVSKPVPLTGSHTMPGQHSQQTCSSVRFQHYAWTAQTASLFLCQVPTLCLDSTVSKLVPLSGSNTMPGQHSQQACSSVRFQHYAWTAVRKLVCLADSNTMPGQRSQQACSSGKFPDYAWTA